MQKLQRGVTLAYKCYWQKFVKQADAFFNTFSLVHASLLSYTIAD